MITEAIEMQCTGCGACVAVCPVGCITMVPDVDGFLYPRAEEDMCVHCELCSRFCHAANIRDVSSDEPSVYCAYNKDEVDRMSSSSGGIFSALGKFVIYSGGAVYGAALAPDSTVVHARITTLEGLAQMRGSKYVQSRIDASIYEDVKTDLNNGIRVLYSGTPCQIGALKYFLSGSSELLYTVSVICHGVPSPKAWSQYMRWQENTNRACVTQAYFRNKDSGWTNYSMKLCFDNGKTYRKSLREDPFLQAFLKNICLRETCYQCQYKGIEHLSDSDIILADWWGMEKGILPQSEDDKGLSIVMVQNRHGDELWQSIIGQIQYARYDYQKAILNNTSYSASVKRNINRDSFMRETELQPFDETVKKYTKSPIKETLKHNAYQVAYKIAKKTGLLLAYKSVCGK